MASNGRTTSSDSSSAPGMPTVLAHDQAHNVARFVAQIIQSSVEIIKQEQDLLNFLDEALEGLGDDYSVEDYPLTEQNTSPAETMTSVAPMPIPVCQLNGEPMSECDEDVKSDQTFTKETAEMDNSIEIPNLSLMHTDGSKQNLSAYIQDIIREAHDKVTTDDAEMAPLATAESSIQDESNLTGICFTDDSPSKESRNATNQDNREEENLSESVVEVPAPDIHVEEAIINNNHHEKTPLDGDIDEIIEIEDDSFGQQSFVEMNSKDRGLPNKKRKRMSRIKDSILNLFSCTSSRATDTS
ncbi:uncharacterized protein LOC110443646 isoform X2 [Mizuhopecten yessoensis]|uniref:Uncharacterized protein n=1 Tax=Mizuhopecten yessoensis TaxID=6573 RepID=A0A210PEG8_MIZYE|nr:uncharacterized protein LOC110443646 isoform X2 [Mizuhopecten yessoensis]OWF34879.1 hypothetical protein KP79_PYT15659 [Mizuhopecten yessoensis]